MMKGAPSMTIVTDGCCPFCFSTDTGEVRTDKNGRPYFRCRWGCGTRAFLQRDIAYQGILFWCQNGTDVLAQVQAMVASTPVPELTEASQ